jgi:hypothetical protein
VQVVDPADELRHLPWRDIQIDDEPLLPASRNYAVKLSIVAGVDLLLIWCACPPRIWCEP